MAAPRARVTTTTTPLRLGLIAEFIIGHYGQLATVGQRLVRAEGGFTALRFIAY